MMTGGTCPTHGAYYPAYPGCPECGEALQVYFETPSERDARRERDEPKLLARIAELEAENAQLKASFLMAADRIAELGTAQDARPFWSLAQERGWIRNA